MADEHAPARPGKGLLVEVRLYAALTIFMVGAGLIYGWWSDWDAAGTVLLILTGGFAGITGGYLAFQIRLERALAASGETEAEEEPYLPHSSVWPLELGVGMTLTFLGLVLGRGVLVLGVVLVGHSLIGWLLQSRARQ